VIESVSERKKMNFDEVQALIVLSMLYRMSVFMISSFDEIVLFTD
jgi:hypothetical protein